MKMTRGKTLRGFSLVEFDDYYDKRCSIQKSSLATSDAIWIGLNDAEPKIMASKTSEGGVGWVPFYVPEDVQINTRMHLTRAQAWQVVRVLCKFVITGNI